MWVRSQGQEDSPGEGHGNPLQYSCLQNPVDRGTWWVTVPGVAKSRTQLKQLSKHPLTYTKTVNILHVCVCIYIYEQMSSLSAPKESLLIPSIYQFKLQFLPPPR